MIRVDYEKCVGCAACANVCPKNCIRMVQDVNGFYYPKVDASNCISCSLCESVCLLEQKTPAGAVPPLQTLAACAKADDVRRNSSSGGAFYFLAQYVFSLGGVVFGAAFDRDLTVHHVCARNNKELTALMRSKYVQSHIGTTYTQVKTLLKQNVPVLFTGTPCQIQGLKSYLGRDDDNLYAVSVACHGAPGEKIWLKYLNYLAVSPSPSKINFRDKSNGWLHYEVAIGEYARPFFKDPYMQLFLADLILRPSCYNCPAKPSQKQFSDLMLADFWGIQNVDPSMFDDRGTSLVLVYSEKGKRLLQNIEKHFSIKPEPFEDALQYNSAISHSVAMPAKRAECLQVLNAKEIPDFKRIAKKYCGEKHCAVRLLKRAAKKVLKVFHVL